MVLNMLRYLMPLVLAAGPLQAGFSVTPLLLGFQTPPGREATEIVTVSNTGDKPLTIELYMKDFRMAELGQESEVAPGTEPRSCAGWLQTAPTGAITIEPGAQQQIRVTMKPPEAISGLYYTKLFITETSKPQASTEARGDIRMTVFVKQRWEVRIHEEVPETATKKGQMTEMGIEKQQEGYRILVGLKNGGNALMRCEGKVEIRNTSGETVSTLPLSGEGIFHVYPESTRKVQAVVKTPLPEGDYVALAIVDYGDKQLIAGEMPFTVTPPTESR